MGCDIHICIQVQEPGISKAEGGTGIPYWKEIPYQDELYEFEKERGGKLIEGLPVAPRDFHGRDYDLFGILAGVRRDNWKLITPDAPRDWPADFDPETVAPHPRYPEEGPRYMGDHSYSWVTLDELKAYDWDAPAQEMSEGLVTGQEYERMRAAGTLGHCPESWCGGVGGGKTRVYSEARWNAYMKRRKTPLPPLQNTPFAFSDKYVEYKWRDSARTMTNDWPGRVIPWLEDLAEGKPLRLVIGFDS